MAKKRAKIKSGFRGWLIRQRRKLARALRRIALAILVVLGAITLFYRFVDPPGTYYIYSETQRLGVVQQNWVAIEDIAPVMLRSVVAAEDANFCGHWGFDMAAIRQAVETGAQRGASTITQQTVKNVYLWPARSWGRKALEAILTPFVELAWPKHRILEVYLNVAEFGEGVFGVQAAAQAFFGRDASALTGQQAALLAAVLPNPKARSVNAVTPFLAERAQANADGAATIKLDGRASCFED